MKGSNSSFLQGFDDGSVYFLLNSKCVKDYFKMLCEELDNNIHVIIFKKLRKNRGYFWKSPRKKHIIELDPRDQILPTLVHELSHSIFPEMSENDISELEIYISRRLTTKQYKTLLEKCVKKIKHQMPSNLL